MYPAGIPGLSARFVSLDGGLSVRVVEGGPRLDEAVVLLHGWGACLYSWSETIPALASAGHRVVAIELPGFGLSDKPTDDAAYTTRAMSHVVRGVVKELGITRYTLVGHSMGGAIALDIATSGEPGLTHMVLISAVGLGRVDTILPVRLISPRIVDRITPRLVTRRLLRIILRVAFGTTERPTERDVEEYFAPSQFDGYARACRASAHRGTWRRVAPIKLRSLRLPVLVIAGGRDLMIRGAADRAKLIPSARIVVLPEAGHLVMQESSSRTNQEIVDFLRPIGRTRGNKP